MDTKLKHKIAKPVKLILICIAAVLACVIFYYLADHVWNGSFVDWFEANYMLTESKWIPGTTDYGLIREPIYAKIKRLLLLVFIGNTIFWLVVIFIASHFFAKVCVRKSITNISKMIHRFMHSERDVTEIFPKEYAEISTQMTEIKSIMQSHEQMLKDEAARKNDLITYLAHDLKTPLTSVIGYLSLLSEAADMPAPQKAKYVNITLDKAKRLETLINEFFEITRYNLQHIELEKENINLCYMLVQMTDEFYPLLQAKRNTIECKVKEDFIVYADAAKLARVFNNILKNAVAYSYVDTVIQVWAEQSDTSIQIYVQNEGNTIPEHKLETIFEKFFRLDDARSSNTGGAGLGLAIAKEIVSAHGGTITARSCDNKTIFCVTLPSG